MVKGIREQELRAEKLKTKIVSTGTRKNKFTRDHTGALVSTNLRYSPAKTTWKGKEATFSKQEQMEVKQKKKRIKMGVKGRGEPEPDEDFE